MAQPEWVTEEGSLGTVSEGEFFQLSLLAYDPDTGDSDDLFFRLLSGELPDGVQVGETGLIAGIPRAVASSQGVPEEVGANVTSEFSVRVYTKNLLGQIDTVRDRTFNITVTGQDIPEFDTPPGEIGRYYDGEYVDLQIEFSDDDPGDEVQAYIASGELPVGLSMDENGRITGHVDPISSLDIDGTAGFDDESINWDIYPWDFGTRSISKNYEFSIKITDGKEYRLRSFSIFVYSRDSMTADNEEQTADDTWITADTVNKRTPYIDNYVSDIGRYRHDNFFVHNFEGIDPDGEPISYLLASGELPPGLNLDMETGYLYGYLDDIGLQEVTYNFSVIVYKVNEEVSGGINLISGWDVSTAGFDEFPYDYATPAVGTAYEYTMTLYGDIDTGVTWLNDGVQINTETTYDASWITSDFLGVINNGEISTFFVEAEHKNGVSLQYRLVPGSNSSLPQGLELLPSGNISGQVSFQTFALDGGTTTFDAEAETRLTVGEETTFDMLFEFTIEAYNLDELVRVSRQFSILVNREYNTPAQTLRIEAYPPQEDRDIVESLVRNQDIIKPEWVYRPDDPWFGSNTKVFYEHAYGLNPSIMGDYIDSVTTNHYRKQITIGDIRTARALSDDGETVLYEVVYAHINDDQENSKGESTSPSITQEFSSLTGTVGDTLTVYPNSFDNMRNEVVDTVGQIAPILPRWMLSKQEDGTVLGFTRAWVIAYTIPGQSEQMKYRLETDFGNQLNIVDFQADRYVLDNFSIQGWDTINGEWDKPDPETFDEDTTTFDTDETEFIRNSRMTTFDRQFGVENETTFDGGSTKFVINSIDREYTDKYDKYIIFPQERIIDNG